MTESPRRASTATLVISLVWYGVGVILANNSDGAVQLAERLEQVSRGWIAPLLLWPLVVLIPFIVLATLIGHLRFRDLGWRAREVIPAAIAFSVAWATWRAFLPRLPSERSPSVPSDPELYVRWAQFLTAQLLGNALLEETFFRSFLIPQLTLRLSSLGKLAAVVVAGAICVALFAVSHLPRLATEPGSDPARVVHETMWVVRFGTVLTVAFLLTQNVFVSVGLHALWNALPFLTVATDAQLEVAWTVSALLSVFVYWLVRRRFSRAVSASSHDPTPRDQSPVTEVRPQDVETDSRT
ncbi:MAG TPA: CPBP family glutamic-type intramembrane protease [Planctomycetota bacterium]|jgi:hypothetical protein|nr:CPBP family glutamic-type intramembrane protease [Planctomycetota bacterium]